MSLKHLFKEYLDSDDSLDGVELQTQPQQPQQPIPAAVVPAQVVTESVPRTVEVQVEDDPVKVGIVQPWFSEPLARKSMGPQSVRLTFYDLFYDFIFAAVFTSFALNISFGWPGGKWLNFVQMIMLLAQWHDNVTLTSVVHSQDPLSHFLLFLQLMGVIGMTFFRNVVVDGGGDTLMGFVVSFLWARFFTIVLYVCLVFSRRAESATKLWAGVYALLLALTCIPAAVTLGLEGSVSTYGRVMIWLVGAGIDHVAAFALPLVPAFRGALPVADWQHLRDRYGAFLVFVFGYILTATFYNAQAPYRAGIWASLSLTWLIAFAFVWLYFGDRSDDERPSLTSHALNRESPLLGQLWRFVHLPLAMAIAILADSAVQVVAFYREEVRLPNTVVPFIYDTGLGLRLSNTVQWIYGVSFGIALFLVAVAGLLYAPLVKRRLERSIGRFMLVLVMVLVPLGGLNSPMEPIVPLIVGSLVLFALVIFDWACNIALAVDEPSTTTRTVAALPGQPAQDAAPSEVLQAKDEEIASLRRQLAASSVPLGGGAAAAGAARDADASSEISSSKEWGFSSRTSSVVEDVVASEDAYESHLSDEASSPNNAAVPASSNDVSGDQEPDSSDGDV